MNKVPKRRKGAGEVRVPCCWMEEGRERKEEERRRKAYPADLKSNFKQQGAPTLLLQYLSYFI